MSLDNKAREDFKINKASVFAWILMSSFIYYHKPACTPLLSDETFDRLCKWTLKHYDDLEHTHAKQYITKEDLRAGSLFKLLSSEYPLWAVRLSEELEKQL